MLQQNGTPRMTTAKQYDYLNRLGSIASSPSNSFALSDALATNCVTVNNQAPYRKVEYFRQQLAVTNTNTSVWQNVNVSDPGKLALAARLRKETTLPLKWIAGRVGLGTSSANTKLHLWMQAGGKHLGHGRR
jgi:hypothetical protein